MRSGTVDKLAGNAKFAGAPVTIDARFERAIRSIDEANEGDPNLIVVDGREQPKELAHARLMTAWIERLRPEAGAALLLAARAHHIRRWEIPRSSYSAGRRPYLQWRTALHRFHSERVAEILVSVGYESDVVERVQAIIQKRNLRRDSDVQAFEDALCLVFLETQLGSLRADHGDEKVHDVLVKTMKKMSGEALELALKLDLDPGGRGLLEWAALDSRPDD